MFIQWTLLYGITDNVINWLMGSNLVQLTSPKLHFHTKWRFKVIHSLLLVGWCNHIGRAQSDPTKQCLLDIFKWISVGVIQFEFDYLIWKGIPTFFSCVPRKPYILCVHFIQNIQNYFKIFVSYFLSTVNKQINLPSRHWLKTSLSIDTGAGATFDLTLFDNSKVS